MDTYLNSVRVQSLEVILAWISFIGDPVVVGEAFMQPEHDIIPVHLSNDAGGCYAQALAVPSRYNFLAYINR